MLAGGDTPAATSAGGAGPRVWLLAVRPQFLSVMALAVALGTAMAAYQAEVVRWIPALLALLAGLLAHAGANLLNDYYDHLSGADAANPAPLSPYAGGSRMIQRALLDPAQVRRLGVALSAGAAALGLWLALLSGPLLLLIGGLGLALGVAYTAPPLALCYRGLGEWAVGANFGVLAVAGAYYVQLGRLDWAPLLVGLAPSLLAAAILYVNQFPDHDADARVGKRTLVVRLGRPRAARRYWWWFAGAAAAIATAVAMGMAPPGALLALLAAPLAVRAQRLLGRAPAGAAPLLPAIRATIAAHALVTGLLLAAFALAAVH